MSTYFILKTERELRTLNTGIVNVRKWLRRQHQILQRITEDTDPLRLIQNLLLETKQQQESVSLLLIKVNSFLSQHANVVLEVDLENLVYLWNTYIQSLRTTSLAEQRAREARRHLALEPAQLEYFNDDAALAVSEISHLDHNQCHRAPAEGDEGSCPAALNSVADSRYPISMEIAGKDVAPVQSAEDKPSEPVGSGLALQGFDLESWSAADGEALDVGSLVPFNVPNLKVTEVLGGDTAGGARRSKVLLDLQSNASNLSSRSESPLSMDSSRSQTPTGTLTRAERQNELWKAIGSIDTFLLDKDIVEACKSMANDLSWEGELTETPSVSFAEFLQQYRELTDWLNQVQKVTEREVTSLSEKYLNQSYHEEMLERSPRREFLNSYSHQLLLRYPHMADQISARMNRLNAQWSVLEHNVAPKYGKQDTDSMLLDLDSDLKTLRRWLDAVEAQLLPLTISADWTRADLEDKLQQHQSQN